MTRISKTYRWRTAEEIAANLERGIWDFSECRINPLALNREELDHMLRTGEVPVKATPEGRSARKNRRRVA